MTNNENGRVSNSQFGMENPEQLVDQQRTLGFVSPGHAANGMAVTEGPWPFPVGQHPVEENKTNEEAEWM